MLTVRFKTFRAIDEPELCEKFIEGHRKVLEIYDIAMITSNKALWTEHQNTYVLLAEMSDTGKAVGGARIQIADDKLPLPIEDAVGQVDKNIYKIVEKYKTNITGELCGLWNSREIAGYGIGSIFLTRAAIAMANLIGLQSLFGLAAPVTVRVASRAGFAIERSLGKNGFFNYPKLDLVATAMRIENLNTLSTANPLDRDRILSLVAEPQQLAFESGPKGKIEVDYQMNLTINSNE